MGVFDQHELAAYFKAKGETKPINVCLRQEVDVLNRVLSKVALTLKNLQLAIDGTIVMSDDLAASLDALANARVPPIWLKGAWFSPGVGIWFASLLAREKQWSEWMKHGRPKSYCCLALPTVLDS